MNVLATRLRPKGALRAGLVALTACLSMLLVTAAAFAIPMPEPGYTVPVDAYEMDNTQALAKPITVGATPQVHTMHAALNPDWVKFPARAGSTYVIDNPDYNSMPVGMKLQGEMFRGMPIVFELLDASGNVLARSAGFDSRAFSAKRPPFMNEQLVWKAPKNQTVYVRISTFPSVDYPQIGGYLVQVRSVVPQITGQLTNPDGEPAAYVYVSAHPAEFLPPDNNVAAETIGGFSSAETYTDEDGNYVLYGLDDGEYNVFFEGSDYYWGNSYLQDEAYDDVHPSDMQSPRALRVGGMAERTGIDAQLDVGPAFISGRVVDEDGEGIEGIEVRPFLYSGSYWYNPSYQYYAITDADGYYVCRNGGSGTWRIGFFDGTPNNRYFPEYYNDATTVDAGTNIVVMGGGVGGYDATLTAIPTLATGTVEDEDGQPLEDVAVEAYDALTSNYITTVYTDENGDWAFNHDDAYTALKFYITDGWDEYAPEWYDDQPTISSATTVTADAEEPQHLATVLEYQLPALSGEITDVNTAAPVAGAQVWLYDYSGTNWFPIDSTVTDADGYYEFPVIYNTEFIVKVYDASGFYATEYYNNVASPFRAQWLNAYPGADLQIDMSLQPQGDRVYGPNRFSTAVAAAKQAFPEWSGVHDVIIASGDDAAAADPLASASLSWAYNAPLLLTKKVGTPAETLAALKAMDVEAEGDLVIHVVGGPGSIPEARMAEMEAIVGETDIERLPYGDRYETARQIALRVHEIAEDTGRDPGMAFIANGSDYGKFFDALSASAVSAHTGSPILLTTTSEVPSATLTALEEIQADDVFVVGGKGSVPDSAMTKVDATARLAGKDRYETSVILAKFGGQYGWLSYTQVGLAAAMPDGMTGGAAMGLLGGPMLITRADSLPSVTYKFIDDNDQLIEHAVIFGGSASVGGPVTQAVKQALKQ